MNTARRRASTRLPHENRDICGYQLPSTPYIIAFCLLLALNICLIFILKRATDLKESSTIKVNENEKPHTQAITIHHSLLLSPPQSPKKKSAHKRNEVRYYSAPFGTPLVIFCYNRPKYLRRTLDSILNALLYTSSSRNSTFNKEFIIYISQDGYHSSVTKIIKEYMNNYQNIFWLGFDYNKSGKKRMKGFTDDGWIAYHKISAHYKFSLNYILNKLRYETVIILEDDMSVSPDFFSYFKFVSKLMSMDDSILCVSAWNDYGRRDLINVANANSNLSSFYDLYRTDIFPGLGWLLTHQLWQELEKQWPLAFWDDWLRRLDISRNRSCIRPEINRVYTFATYGTSMNTNDVAFDDNIYSSFYERYLKPIHLNSENVDWSEINFRYLLNENYDKYMKDIISSAIRMKSVVNVMYDIRNKKRMKKKAGQIFIDDNVYVVSYRDLNDYNLKTKTLHMLDDHKEGLPRQSYRGIVVIRVLNQKVLFVPKDINWEPRIVPEN